MICRRFWHHKEFTGTNNLRGKPAKYISGSLLTRRSKTPKFCYVNSGWDIESGSAHWVEMTCFGRGCSKSHNNKLKTLIFSSINKTELSILLTSFSKEKFLDYDLTQDAVKTLLRSLGPLGEEGFREIDITLIIKAYIPRFGLFRQPQFID